METKKEGRDRIAIAACYIRDSDNEYFIESPHQKVESEPETTGAGDAFAAGFLYGLLKEKELEVCGRLGDIVAQFAISQAGARPGLPTLEQLSGQYRELYKREL
jgi:ribokinase